MKPRAPRERFLVSHVDDEIVLFDPATERYHHLNPAAALVWERCDGERDEEALGDALAASMDAESPRRIVEEALRQLRSAGLLEPVEDAGSAENPVGAPGMDRRRALRRMAAVGAAAVALPLVTTLAAPSPAVARSPAGTKECDDDDWDDCDDEWDDDWDDDDWDDDGDDDGDDD